MYVHGTYEELGGRRHFTPYPLADLPEIALSGELTELYGEAMHRLGRLDAAAASLPDVRALIKAYVTKEALLSSEIEGTVTTLTEVMAALQTPERRSENRDTQDVVNDFEAARTALRMLKEEGLPLVERVVKAAHRVLLDTDAGRGKAPGAYRSFPVAVGGHVPPPANRIPALMRDWEAFVNGNAYPPLLKAGIAHAQFETIHPFLDGNGRIGRLLIVLGFIHDGLLREPLIYPSYYFKRFRSEYYAWLDGIRTKGDWSGWLRFYLRAVNETAADTAARMERLTGVIREYEGQIAALSIKNGDRLLSVLLERPVPDIPGLARAMSLSYPTADTIVKKLVRAGVLTQRSTGKRNKTYRLEAYMAVLEEDTPF
jgi:Uncharacterized conserved protein